MVTRFPHTLKFNITVGQGPSVQDENGDWVTDPVTPNANEVTCRAVPNGKGDTISGENGDKIQFDFLIYAPTGINGLIETMAIEFFNDSTLIGSGTIKRVFASQKNTKIWV